MLLVGSEPCEIVRGRQELEAFFEWVYSGEVFSWAWDHIGASQPGDVVRFFDDGHAIEARRQGERSSACRAVSPKALGGGSAVEAVSQV